MSELSFPFIYFHILPCLTTRTHDHCHHCASHAPCLVSHHHKLSQLRNPKPKYLYSFRMPTKTPLLNHTSAFIFDVTTATGHVNMPRLHPCYWDATCTKIVHPFKVAYQMKSPSTDSTESIAEPTCGLREKTSARPDRQHIASHRLTRTRTVAHECSTTPPALCMDSPHRGLGTSSRFLGRAHLVSRGQNWGSPKTTWVPGNRFTNRFHGRKNNSESTIPTRTLIAGILLGTVNAHLYASRLYVRSHITGSISTTIGIPTFSR